MPPLSTKVEFCRLYPKTDFYVFLVSFSAFECYSVNQSVHFRALVYYCFHVVHSALWSRMWSKLAPLKSTSGHLKIGQSIRCAVASARRKPTEKSKCGQPESSRPKDVVINNRKRVVKPCGRKSLRAGKQTPTSRAFLLPPVSYCNSCCSNCQVQNSLCLLLVGRTRRA